MKVKRREKMRILVGQDGWHVLVKVSQGALEVTQAEVSSSEARDRQQLQRISDRDEVQALVTLEE